MNKTIKVILLLLVGFGILGLLSFLSVTYLFKDIQGDSSISVVTGKPEEISLDSNFDYTGGSQTPDVVTKEIAPTYYIDESGDGSKLVKTSYISMTIVDFDSTVSEIKTLTKDYNGYILSMTDNGIDNKRRVELSLRVPSDKFDVAVTEIKKLGVTIVSSTENTNDVSATYRDLETRIKNQKAYEKQLLSILSKAEKVTDILNIQKEVSQVRQEIEIMESQIKSFDRQVSMSVITVSMNKASEALDVTGQDWKAQGVFAEALTALVAFGKGLATMGIWIMVFSPIVLIPYGIFYIVKKNKKA